MTFLWLHRYFMNIWFPWTKRIWHAFGIAITVKQIIYISQYVAVGGIRWYARTPKQKIGIYHTLFS